jgi:hypothetical protein
MKNLTIALLLLTACSVQAQSDLSKLNWLNGTWNRTNAKPGRSGVEIWQKVSNTEMVGKGVSLKGADTAFVEKLKIIIKGNDIFYVADVPENKEPVLFKLTSLTANNLTFENPQHDFPKKISYELNGAKLKATVSGDGRAQEFWFEKK